MFENLKSRFAGIFKKLKGEAFLTERNVEEALKNVRIALLEADVNYKVVKDFLTITREKAMGEKVLKSITPAQQFVKVVHDELVRIMGEKADELIVSPIPPSIYMLVGIQGSGKTTTSAKLALLLKNKGKKVLLVATDTRRPAAKEQLRILGEKIESLTFTEGNSPLSVAINSLPFGRKMGCDTIIIDTQGRLQVDKELMKELKIMKEKIKPTETLLVADSMTGQEAVNIAQTFNEYLNLDGIILSKMDSDARGGAALSMRMVTGCPIKFIGTGEKLKDLEQFYPDRIASRILGMGDIVTLVEKAEVIEEEESEKVIKKLKANEFDFEDFLSYLQKMKNIGPLNKLLDYLPVEQGVRDVGFDETHYKRVEAIILSMTKEERENPRLIGASRKKRISKGSGTSVQQVNQLLKQFQFAKKRMHEMVKKGGLLKRKGWLPKIG